MPYRPGRTNGRRHPYDRHRSSIGLGHQRVQHQSAKHKQYADPRPIRSNHTQNQPQDCKGFTQPYCRMLCPCQMMCCRKEIHRTLRRQPDGPMISRLPAKATLTPSFLFATQCKNEQVPLARFSPSPVQLTSHQGKFVAHQSILVNVALQPRLPHVSRHRCKGCLGTRG